MNKFLLSLVRASAVWAAQTRPLGPVPGGADPPLLSSGGTSFRLHTGPAQVGPIRKGTLLLEGVCHEGQGHPKPTLVTCSSHRRRPSAERGSAVASVGAGPAPRPPSQGLYSSAERPPRQLWGLQGVAV